MNAHKLDLLPTYGSGDVVDAYGTGEVATFRVDIWCLTGSRRNDIEHHPATLSDAHNSNQTLIWIRWQSPSPALAGVPSWAAPVVELRVIGDNRALPHADTASPSASLCRVNDGLTIALAGGPESAAALRSPPGLSRRPDRRLDPRSTSVQAGSVRG
jgi:hypothetical protein